jgi:hypothetical protein
MKVIKKETGAHPQAISGTFEIDCRRLLNHSSEKQTFEIDFRLTSQTIPLAPGGHFSFLQRLLIFATT